MKNQNKKYFAIILVLSFLFVAVFGLDKLTKRIPLSKDEAILEVNFNADNYVIDFSELVSGYEVNYYTNERNLNKNDAILFAWTSPIKKYMNAKSMASKEIESSTVLDLLYSDVNDGGRNQLLNREHSDFAGGSALLGRLALNYYNIIALSILLIISVFKRMKLKDISKSLSKNLSYVSLFAITYLISGVLVLGINQVTYFIVRDLLFILAISTLLFLTIIYAQKYLNPADELEIT